MNERILLIGGGGHCKSVLDSLLRLEIYSDIGIIDVQENVGRNLLGISVVGCDDDLERLFKKGYGNAFVTLGSIGNPTNRIRLLNRITAVGFRIPAIIDSSAIVSSDAQIGTGVFIGKGAIINAGCVINTGVIINSGAIIEHDCIIGAFAHVAPGTVLSGGVQIGENTHIGAHSVIRQQLTIGSGVTIGIGSVVVADIEKDVIAYGNPCREVRLSNEKDKF
ncbi:acetyltransferase [Paenibacillus etheri]|uniref:Serine acetyltransferase n=1 Tax=Paenibacillus etheri TaxID=1306852 RepID=A0A0W1AR83_9BACL|nr:acetyltransferase [Paenibacillus etheri]KTD83849.1 serine acetyltransferase [Paenibacillus etheri]